MKNLNWNVLKSVANFYLFSKLCRHHLGKSEPREALQQEIHAQLLRFHESNENWHISEIFKQAIRMCFRLEYTLAIIVHIRRYCMVMMQHPHRLSPKRFLELKHEQRTHLMLVVTLDVSYPFLLSDKPSDVTVKSPLRGMMVTTSSTRSDLSFVSRSGHIS